MQDQTSNIDLTDNARATLLARMLEKYGLPTVLLCGFLGVVTYATYRFAQWAAPLAEKSVQKHLEFVDLTSKTHEQIVATQKDLQEAEKHQEKTLESLNENARGTREAVEAMNETLKRLPMPPGSE